jgi:Transposase IS66 family
MSDAPAEFRQQIVDDIDRYRDTEIAALNADPWVAISLLQKSIRRGDALTAQRAARTHSDLRGSAIFRRFMVIAFEDIGAASPAIVAMRRLIERKQDTLRFLHDAAVPFTNNQAERDGRMMKVKMKISGGFRCQDGADDFAIIRSFISTAKKRGWNVIHALTQEPQSLIASLGPA